MAFTMNSHMAFIQYRGDMGLFEISIMSLYSPKMGDLQSHFFIFWKIFSNMQKFGMGSRSCWLWRSAKHWTRLFSCSEM